MSSSYYKYGTNLQDREFFTSTVNTSNGVKRYFSNIEGEIYFGNKLIEDIYKFDFVVEEKKLPLYGYNCFYPEIIIPGQRIVQGSFVINFTNGAYISNVLNEIEDSILSNNIVECETYNPSGTDRDLAIWGKSFDIMIGYGYYKTDQETYNATCQTICGVQITNKQNVIDTSGEPIMEAYSFIAKDFIDGDVIQNSNTAQENNEETEIENDSDNTSIYICLDTENLEEVSDNYNKYKDNQSIIPFLHSIHINSNYNLKTISFSVTNFDNELIKCENIKLLITERLGYNFTTYNLERNSDNVYLYSFEDNVEEGNIIYNALKDGEYEKLSCNLKYAAIINDQKHDINYNGYLYLDIID